MKHGKDYLVDKPGITTLEQLAEARKVQKETKRIYAIMFSERLENRATVKAGELAKSGAIGTVVQTVIMAPHRMSIQNKARLVLGIKKDMAASLQISARTSSTSSYILQDLPKQI
jgi:predicted dehydrogenase